MDRKGYLAFGLKGLVLIALIAIMYPFFAALGPSEKALDDSLVVVSLPDLQAGVVYSVDVKGHFIFVLKPNEEQSEAIKTLDAHVSEVLTRSFKDDSGVYVYWAYSSKWGCPLEHKPPQQPQTRGWDPKTRWLGGYWDGQCEVSYDYAGRAIKSHQYTFNGYTWNAEGLRTPAVFKKSGDKYVVSIYQRKKVSPALAPSTQAAGSNR